MMETSTTLNQFDIATGKIVKTNSGETTVSIRRKIKSHAIGRLIIEGGKDFFHYLKSLDLVNDPNMLVLSAKDQYYYEHYELKCTRTLIILQKLNLIKNIEVLLQVLHQTLAPNSSFIGYFYDSDTRIETGMIPKLYQRLINYLDSRTERNINREEVIKLFESFGFQVIDMTTINGLTYFRTQRI